MSQRRDLFEGENVTALQDLKAHFAEVGTTNYPANGSWQDVFEKPAMSH